MPPGIDPTDYRAFYPYTPNEVKHRKRTTSAQLKVLEGIFKRDTKPNAALRTELASQLNMTARGVQVWFQNRRAKEKTKAAKGVSKKDADSPSTPSSEDPDELSPPLPGLSTSESPSPTATDPPSLHLATDSATSSWQGSPVIETPEDPSFDLPSLHMIQNRRGSLPVNALGCGNPLVDPLDPLARRRSVDASLVRLAGNPYAGIARAKNSALLATQRSSHSRRNHLYAARPGMPHRATVPVNPHTRHASMDARGYRIPPSPSPSPLSPYHAARGSLPDHHLYPVPSRSIAAPIPGPLPNPAFSFGIANASPESCDRNSPVDFGGFSFPPPSDADTEDDSSASYPMSRFGSIASESSATSAYFSDVGSTGETPDYRSMRRDSCPTGFLNSMSGLDVNGPRRASLAEGLLGIYSGSSERGTVGYPSPSSTASPGDSPQLSGNGPNNSNELNYALHQEGASENAPTFFFDSNGNSNTNSYPHSAPANSDGFGNDKFYDYSMQFAPHSNEGYPEAGAYGEADAQGGQQQQYHNGGLEFAQAEPFYESSASHPGADRTFTYP